VECMISLRGGRAGEHDADGSCECKPRKRLSQEGIPFKRDNKVVFDNSSGVQVPGRYSDE
jgi:hypothetical protein